MNGTLTAAVSMHLLLDRNVFFKSSSWFLILHVVRFLGASLGNESRKCSWCRGTCQSVNRRVITGVASLTARSVYAVLTKSLNESPHCICPFSPDAADSSSFDVQLGDIILTATDGLFDNMPDYMILQELKKLKVGSAQVCWWENNQKCRSPDDSTVFLIARIQTTRASRRRHAASQNRPTSWPTTPTTCLPSHSSPVTTV